MMNLSKRFISKTKFDLENIDLINYKIYEVFLFEKNY